MDKVEVAKIITSISALFPNYKLSETEMKNTINAWTVAFDGMTYKDINNALLMYVRTSGSAYPPSAPQLIAMLNKPVELSELNPIEAWNLVSRAVRRSNYYADEEYEKLPPNVQKAVGSPDQLAQWAQSDIESFETVIASNFQRNYKVVLDRQKQISFMPDSMKSLVVNTAAAIEEKR